MAIEAVRIILANLETAYRDGSNMEARANMAYGALLGGLSFALPKTAASHACSYPLSEDYHLPHGEACAFTLDSFIRINRDERLDTLCRRAGLRDAEELADRVRALKALAGLRSRLSELENGDAHALAAKCAVHPLMSNNPVKMDAAALEVLFEALR
jgi:alcohol dehydrogenase